MIEHDPAGFSLNVLAWAKKNNHTIHQLNICKTEIEPSDNNFDLLIIAGGVQHVWDDEIYPWLPKEKHFIANVVDQNKFILGICLGAQLLAETLGGKVFPNLDKEIGWHEVQLTHDGKESQFFNNVPEQFTIFHWHNDHFSLPPECQRLAYNTASKNQAFTNKNRRILGIQFHPDYNCHSIIQLIQEYEDEWPTGRFVTNRDYLLQQTSNTKNPSWLMNCLLDNISQFV